MAKYGIVNHGSSRFEVQEPGHKVAVFEQFEDAQMFVAMYEALVEIAKGEGPFSRDRLTHAENTIAHMVELAKAALDGGWEAVIDE